MRSLVKYGANVNAFDVAGVTPLHVLIVKHNQTATKTLVTMAQFLVASGANLHAVHDDDDDKSVLELCDDSNVKAILASAKPKATLVKRESTSSNNFKPDTTSNRQSPVQQPNQGSHRRLTFINH